MGVCLSRDRKTYSHYNPISELLVKIIFYYSNTKILHIFCGLKLTLLTKMINQFHFLPLHFTLISREK